MLTMHLRYFSLGLFSFVALGLTGCTVGSFPGVSVQEPEAGATVSPPITGNVYGGHAPIVGAQVYILTPSQTTLYGQSPSLMDGDSQNSTLTPSGTGNGLVSASGTNGYHYVTTDSTGSFTLTNDYACTVDQAVYLVAVGGSPKFPSGSNAFQVSQIVVSNLTGTGAAETATYTMTTTTTQNLYEGEQVTLSGFSGDFAFLASTETVLATNLTTTTFAFTGADSSGGIAAGTYNATTTPNGTGTITANPTVNPAVINMTALGLCPASGTFANNVKYIYMNEVSTAAMATAMGAFGSGPFNVGVATGGTVDAHYASYDKNGMKQAMNNAGLLYDYQGGNLSSTYAGEGHIARSVTPAGNGIVPQALMDTLGNILAACVDSQNTTTTASPQCITLFENATSTGLACTYSVGAYTCPNGTTAPADIATAAFNIAHFPAGTPATVGTNPAFVNALYNLPTGNVPFAPALTAQPNDFSASIAFFAPSAGGSTTNYISAPQAIAINGGNYVGNESNYTSDAAGEIQESVWITNFGVGSATTGPPTVKLYANGGAPDYTVNTALQAAATGDSRSVAIDGANNVWMTQQFGQEAYEFSVTGGLLQTFHIPTALNNYDILDAAIDGAGTSYNLYLAGYAVQDLIKAAIVNGTTPTATNLQTNNVPGNAAFSVATATTGSGTAACVNYSTTFAFSPAGVLFLNNDGNIYANGAGNDTCIINTTTGAQTATAGSGSGLQYETIGQGPATIAVDKSGTAWVGGGQTNATTPVSNGVHSISSTGTLTTYTGGGMNDPCGVAVDGANSIWVGNAGTYGVSHFSDTGVALSPVANTGTYANAVGGLNPQINNSYTMPGTTTSVFATPTTGSNCASPAIDRAGDVWMAYQGSSAPVPGVIFEILGVAAPVVTPRSYATFGNGTTGFLGVRPY